MVMSKESSWHNACICRSNWPSPFQVQYTTVISLFCCCWLNLCFSRYPLTFLYPTENRNLGRRRGRSIPRCISLQERAHFLKPISRFHLLVALLFFSSQLVFASCSRAGSFTHFIIVHLNARLDKRNSFMKNSSNIDVFQPSSTH